MLVFKFHDGVLKSSLGSRIANLIKFRISLICNEGRKGKVKFKTKSFFIVAATLTVFLAMSFLAMAQSFNGFSGSYGFGGQGWSAGNWTGSDVVPDDYTRNGIAWGAVGTSTAGVGAGIGYGGGGIAIKVPGTGTIRLGY